MQKQISNFFSPAQLCLFSLPCFKYFNQNYKWFEPAKEIQTRTWTTLQVSGTSLTHLILLVSFYTPWNNKKTIELLMFLESIERAVAFKWVIFRLFTLVLDCNATSRDSNINAYLTHLYRFASSCSKFIDMNWILVSS